MIKPWWLWAFWVSPLSYGQRAISVNEFTAERWMEVRYCNDIENDTEFLFADIYILFVFVELDNTEASWRYYSRKYDSAGS